MAAAWLLLPVVTRRRLGVLHPAVVWLALEGFFFGVGSLALALGEDRPGAALYLGACVLAAAAGVRLAHRYGPFAAGAPIPDPSASPEPETGGRRWVPVALAVGALAVLTPTFLEIGIPLFSHDATVARTALTGIPIQLFRVAIPGLAAVLLLEWLAGRPALGRPIVTLVVIGSLVALTISLASRYLVIELVAVPGPGVAADRPGDPGPRGRDRRPRRGRRVRGDRRPARPAMTSPRTRRWSPPSGRSAACSSSSPGRSMRCRPRSRPRSPTSWV